MSSVFNSEAMLFSVKSLVAAILALYIALSMGQSEPSWAILTTYIVAQPKAGAVLSKGFYRAIGTTVGAAMSVLLVPPLVNAPELLSAAAALWLGFCVFLAAIDRTSRSYMFVLAGYSASIIIFPSAGHPDVVFPTAVARVQEITIGIICSSVVHATILPRSSTQFLLGRIDGTLRDLARWTADALSVTALETLDQDLRRLAIAVNEIYELLAQARYESASLSQHHRLYRALLAQIERALPLSAAVHDRILELRRAGAVTKEIAALLTEVHDWVTITPASETERRTEAERLRQCCAAREPLVMHGMEWRDALTLSLLARLSDLILVHESCLVLREATLSRAGITGQCPRVATLLETQRRAIDRDYAGALALGASTTVALFTACMLWIASGWDGGAGAVTIAGILFALYSSLGNPTLLLKNKFIGVVVRTMLALLYVLAILPAIDGFPLLAASLAPALLVSGVVMTVPRYSALAFNLVIGLLNSTLISERFEPDFEAYLNNSMATLIGVCFTLVMMRLTQSLWLKGAARRLLSAGWNDIARGRYEAISRWRSQMGHRLALLTLRVASDGAAGAALTTDALRDLRTGIALAELAGLRSSLPKEAQIEVGSIRDGAVHYYHDLTKGLDDFAPAALLERIDHAIQTGLGASDAAVQRKAIIALVSLRHNLLPSAGPMQSALAYYERPAATSSRIDCEMPWTSCRRTTLHLPS